MSANSDCCLFQMAVLFYERGIEPSPPRTGYSSSLPKLFGDKKIEASVDEIYTLEEVNKALEKVAAGGSRGKTILRIS